MLAKQSPAYQALLALNSESLIDQSPLVDAVTKILDAFKAMTDDHTRMQQENDILRNELALVRKDMQAVNAQANKAREFSSRFEALETRTLNVEALLRTIDVGFIKSAAEQMTTLEGQVASSHNLLEIVQNELKLQRKQQTVVEGSLRDALGQLQISMEKLNETKANASDITDLRRINQMTASLADKCSQDVGEMKETMSSFQKNVELQMANKANAGDLMDKLGRGEADEMLQALSIRIGQELHKSSKACNEMREDVDFMLQLLLQKEETASGAFKCLSCAKMVPMTKPGAAPGSGRSPVLTQGEDGQFYQGQRSTSTASPDLDVSSFKAMSSFASAAPTPQYENRWERSSTSSPIRGAGNNVANAKGTPARPKSALSSRSSEGKVPSAEGKVLPRPASAGPQQSPGRVRPMSASRVRSS